LGLRSGPKDRANASAKRESVVNSDKEKDVGWKPSATEREAFKDEARRIREDGGVANPQNYNRRNSPGERYLQQDGE
jgi:hypothetical protein